MTVTSKNWQQKRLAFFRVHSLFHPHVLVDLDSVGGETGDGSVDDLVDHLVVAVGLLQLGGRDPDLSVRGDVLPGLSWSK